MFVLLLMYSAQYVHECCTSHRANQLSLTQCESLVKDKSVPYKETVIATSVSHCDQLTDLAKLISCMMLIYEAEILHSFFYILLFNVLQLTPRKRQNAIH